MRMRKNQTSREEEYAATVLTDVEEIPESEEEIVPSDREPLDTIPTISSSGPLPQPDVPRSKNREVLDSLRDAAEQLQFEHTEDRRPAEVSSSAERPSSPVGVPLSVVAPSPEERALDKRRKQQIIRRHNEKTETQKYLRDVLTQEIGVPEGEIPSFGKTLDMRRIHPEEAAQVLLRRNEEALASRQAPDFFAAAPITPDGSPTPPVSGTSLLKDDPFGNLQGNLPPADPKAAEAEDPSSPLQEAGSGAGAEESLHAETSERPPFREQTSTTPLGGRPGSAARPAPEFSPGIDGVGRATVLLKESREPHTALLLEDGNVVLLHEKTGKFTSMPLEALKAHFVTVEGRPIRREDFLAASETQRRNIAATSGAPTGSVGPGMRAMPSSATPPGRETALAANLVALMTGGIRFVGAFFNECLNQCRQFREKEQAVPLPSPPTGQPTEATTENAASRPSPRFGPVDTEGLSTMEAYRARRAARLYDGMCEKMDRVEVALDALSENAVVKDFRLRLLENPAAGKALWQEYDALLRESAHPDVQDARVKTALLFQQLHELRKDLPETSRAFGLVDQKSMGKLNERLRAFSAEVDGRPESAFISDLKSEASLKEKVGDMLERVREVLENTFRSFMGRKTGEEAFSLAPC